MRFSSFIVITAAGLAIAAPITPVSTDKTLTIQPAEVVKRQTTLDPVVDAAHGKLPVPIKRATPSVSSLGALTGAVPGGLPVGKRQLGGLLPSGSSTDDGSETAEEPKIPKEPKEPSSVTDGTTEIDDGTAESSTSSAASALGGLPIGKRAAPSVSSLGALTGAVPGGLPVGKRQLSGITDMLSPKPADPEAATADEAAPSDADSDAPKEAEEPTEGEDAPAEGDAAAPVEEEPAPPADQSALAGILKRQLGGLTKGLIPSSTPEDAKDAEPADKAAEDETAPADETAEEEAAPAEDKTAEETAPAKNATEPAPAKKEKTGGLLGSLGM